MPRMIRVLLPLLAASSFGGQSIAGPPFLTDEPVPTDPGRWELCTPFAQAEGRGGDVSGSFGAEINFGAAPDVQVTFGLPLAFAHDASGTGIGAGDVDVSVKYRFLHVESAGLSVAAFPALTLPTASGGRGDRTVTAFLPVWAQKDFGPWSLFGGGGYAINPGAGRRDSWRAAVALSRQIAPKLLAGIEAERTGPDVVGEGGTTSLGAGAILQVGKRVRLLASGGPAFEDGAPRAAFHAFVALGLDY